MLYGPAQLRVAGMSFAERRGMPSSSNARFSLSGQYQSYIQSGLAEPQIRM